MPVYAWLFKRPLLISFVLTPISVTRFGLLKIGGRKEHLARLNLSFCRIEFGEGDQFPSRIEQRNLTGGGRQVDSKIVRA